MNKAKFLEDFDVIADAPIGIKMLRGLIVSLATKGVLTDSDIGKWKVQTANDVFKSRSGNSKLIKGKLFNEPSQGKFPGYSASGQDVWLETWEHDATAAILSAVGARCGKAFLAQGKWSAIANTHIIWIPQTLVIPDFAMLILNNEDFWIRSGTAQPFVKVKATLERQIGIPPLGEQSKIVAKVDELMARCDELEAQQAKRESLRIAARKSALDAISTAQTEEELQTAWRRIQNNWEVVSGTPEEIGALRNLILGLAMTGKLVDQRDEDGRAAELLTAINNEKLRILNVSKIKPSQEITYLNELPDLPKTWVWTKLDEIGVVSPRNSCDDAVEAGFIPMAQISENFSTPHCFELRPWGEIKKGYTHVRNGDVALAKITPCFENGKSTLIAGLPNEIGAGTTEIHVVRPIMVDPSYILVFLNSPIFVLNGILRMTGTAGQKRLPTHYFSHFPFPLPPLPEQKRIVAKVDEFMALCDELEMQQVLRDQLREKFAESALAATEWDRE